MKIATGIITAPRPRPTLNLSLASYRDAGFISSRTMIFADGKHRPVTSDPATIIHDGSTLGNLRNWNRALKTLFQVHTDCEWLMVCEDDISWAERGYETLMKDLALFAVSQKFKSTGALSLYAPVRVTNDLERQRQQSALLPGWYLLNHGLKTWGAQCLLFSRAQADDLLTCKVWEYYVFKSGKDKNVDAFVAESVLKRKLAIGYRIPCLVDHEFGEANSSLGYKDDRPALKTRYFAG